MKKTRKNSEKLETLKNKMVLPSIGTKKGQKTKTPKAVFASGVFAIVVPMNIIIGVLKNEKNENGYQITLILYH